MCLKERRRHTRREWPADHPFDARRLRFARGQQNHRLRLENGADSHGQRLTWDTCEVAAKKSRTRQPRPFEQRHAMRGCGQFVRGLVETDVTVGANAEQLQSDSTRSLDRGLVAIAFGVEIVCRAVEPVKATTRETDVLDQLLTDEAVKAGRMGVVDADEFVQRESGGARE